MEETLRLLGRLVAGPEAMLVYGLVFHFLKAMGEIKKNTGTLIGPRQYYMQNPYQTGMSFIGAVVGFVLLVPELPDPKTVPKQAYDALVTSALIMSFMVGYMADSVVDVIGQRSGLNKPENKP